MPDSVVSMVCIISFFTLPIFQDFMGQTWGNGALGQTFAFKAAQIHESQWIYQ
jgi:hypothetical protein